MPVLFSDVLGVDSSDLDDLGVFDPVLDVDTRFFIDPHLLSFEETPEFSGSYAKLESRFSDVGLLLSNSSGTGDIFWKQAEKLLLGNEVKGLCIGYSQGGTSGSGIGKDLRTRLLETAKMLIDKGRDSPKLFELAGVFQEKYGPDRISDLTARIIQDDIVAYTKRLVWDIDAKFNKAVSKSFNLDGDGLPINPYTQQSLLLVPKTILRDLPIALDWSNRDEIAAHNQELRERLNALVGKNWRQAIYDNKKKALRDIIIENPVLFDDLVDIYSEKPRELYDFQDDRAGEYVWVVASRKAVERHPYKVKLSNSPSIDEVEKVVFEICNQFKKLVENNGLNKLLYDKKGDPKHESAAQLLFYGIADAYCEVNELSLSRESDAGRGPVDFKVGTAKQNSVLVEIKKSTNIGGLQKGIRKQLPEYMGAEGSKRAIYLVIEVGYTQAAIQKLNEINKEIGGARIKILQVDAMLKPSASKS